MNRSFLSKLGTKSSNEDLQTYVFLKLLFDWGYFPEISYQFKRKSYVFDDKKGLIYYRLYHQSVSVSNFQSPEACKLKCGKKYGKITSAWYKKPVYSSSASLISE